MTMILRHTELLLNGTKAHLTRAMVSRSRPKVLHGHDFYEVFWVQNGRLRHHTPEGTEVLNEGTLVLLSPGQMHALQGIGDDALTVTICLNPMIVAGLIERHPALQFDADKPHVMQNDMREMTALNQTALTLEASKRDSLATEAFLLPLLSRLQTKKPPTGAPQWLVDALIAARRPEVFKQGASGLVSETGRAHAHVSRSMRKFTGKSPSEYINSLRMEYAARALTTDSEPVGQIAADCGIPNMAHFHKLFRAHHGLTPLQYRQRFQRNVIQPG